MQILHFVLLVICFRASVTSFLVDFKTEIQEYVMLYQITIPSAASVIKLISSSIIRRLYRWLSLPDSGFFLLKGIFLLSTVTKCLLTRGLSTIVGSLPYSIEHLEATVVVLFCTISTFFNIWDRYDYTDKSILTHLFIDLVLSFDLSLNV